MPPLRRSAPPADVAASRPGPAPTAPADRAAATSGPIVRSATACAAVALTAGLALAGCSASDPSSAAPSPSTPPATSPATSPAAEPSGPVRLPWPAPTAAEAAALQTGVDGGAQPWLLDPAEVALSYVAAAHGWSGAEAGVADATPAESATVTVRAAEDTVTLTLTQPVRPGPTGIWVVTAEAATGP